MSDIIQLTDTARLSVEQDIDAINPRKDWDMATGFVKVPGKGDSRLADVPAVHDDTARLLEAYDTFYYGGGVPRFTDLMYRKQERAIEFVIRYARVFHGLHVEYDHEHGGFWFVSPTEIAINTKLGGGWDKLERQAEIIEGERETYRQWAEGEVCGVLLERAATWARLDDSGRPITLTEREEWEVVESIWGCYLDDEYTPQIVADEHFDLSDEEYLALGLKGRFLHSMPNDLIVDVRLAEEDVPLIDGDRLTAAGELYVRSLCRAQRQETPAEAITGLSGEY